MTTWGNADFLVDVLDRQLEFLLKQEGARRVFLLGRFLGFLHAEPQLAGLTAEVVDDARSFLRAATSADHDLRERFAKTWAEFETDIRAALGEEAADPKVNAFVPLDSFAALAAKRPHYRIPDGSLFEETRTETEKLASALVHWAGWIRSKLDSVPDWVARFTSLANVAQLDAAHQKRKFATALETLAGVAYLRLTRALRRANPRPPLMPDMSGFTHGESLASFFIDNEFAARLHAREPGDESHSGEDVVSVEAELIACDAQLLVNELQRRILVGRSRAVLVARYAARCEGFDAEQLRKEIADNAGPVEPRLTRHFARYLFDNGLMPVLDGTIGGLRPDVLSVAPGFLFYVEAKQYGEGITRSEVRKWYRQVWSTWARLANQHSVPEAFLIIFRTGGVLLDPPRVIRCRDRVLHSVLVDLSQKAGSRERGTPLSFVESELLPVSPTDEQAGLD